MRFGGVTEKSCENRESISVLQWDAFDWDSLLEEWLFMRPLIHGRPTISSQFSPCSLEMASSPLFVMMV